jgi:hypothetical protein
MNITGHNSYNGCRFCDIQGDYSQKHKHVYFPPGKNYYNKNHSDWISYIDEIDNAETSRDKETLIRKYGKYFILFCYQIIINYN